MRTFQEWRKARVRLIQWGGTPNYPYYVRFTPNFGISIPWFRGRRIRFAWHHGLQLVRWVNVRWYVEKQVWGKSTVKGEQFLS